MVDGSKNPTSGHLGADMPASAEIEPVDPARAGRKPGAKGKFTAGLSEQIREAYGRSPAEELARRAMMNPKDYAREASMYKGKGDAKTLDVGRAWERQARHLVALLPYTEKKMPTEVEITDQKRVILQIGTIGAPDAVEAPLERTIDLVPANITKAQQNQRLSLSPSDKSDEAKSDERR